MKQLLFIIITFMFVSNVYAEDSSAYVLAKGKIISSNISSDKREVRMGVMYHIVYYKKKMFSCRTNRVLVKCRELADYPVVFNKLE